MERVARHLFVPFSVGGGVQSWEDALRLLDRGADRISVGTAEENGRLLLALGERLA